MYKYTYIVSRNKPLAIKARGGGVRAARRIGIRFVYVSRAHRTFARSAFVHILALTFLQGDAKPKQPKIQNESFWVERVGLLWVWRFQDPQQLEPKWRHQCFVYLSLLLTNSCMIKYIFVMHNMPMICTYMT